MEEGVNSGERRAEEEEGKKWRENNEGSRFENNESDKVHMLIKCFGRVSGGCVSSVGTWGEGTKLCRTHAQTHTHAGPCCPCAPLLVRMAGVKCFVPDCQPLWAIYRHGDMSAFICETPSLSLSLFPLSLSVSDHLCVLARMTFILFSCQNLIS